MKPQFVLVIAACLSMVVAWEPGYCAPGEPLLTAAAHLVAGDLGRARRLFAEAAQADGLSAVAVAGVGAAELLGGRVEPARGSFEKALVLSPSLPCAHMGLGTALCLLGDYRGAMSQYHGALIGGPRRPSTALAGEAYAACALGLYDTALEQSRAALVTAPEQPVANYVFAAAALARGDPQPAAQLETVRPSGRGQRAIPISLGSCLLSPGVAYWQRHALEDQARLRKLGDLVALSYGRPREAPLAAQPTEDFKLIEPREGQVVSGATTVRIAVAEELDLDHVVVRVNDSFAGISSAQPHRIAVDTRLFAGGVAEIRADGYTRDGVVVRSARVAVKIQNGSRTLAPEEAACRKAVGELLEEMLLPSVSSVATKQLAGHGLLQLGQAGRAAAAFESAYAADAETPGLRTDLLLAYDALGLRPSRVAPEVYCLSGGRKSVALTFDDGPHPLITPWILDQLDKEGVKATFFLVGKQVTLYPELVREIRRRGHVVGSHSYAHRSFRHLTPVECEQDLVKSRLAIREACGETVTLFRPPGGYYDASAKGAAGALGFVTVFWSCNITSYPGLDGARIAAEMARQSADGGIILLHNGEDETLDTLPYLVPELRKRGARLVTISPRDASLARGARPAEGGQ